MEIPLLVRPHPRFLFSQLQKKKGDRRSPLCVVSAGEIKLSTIQKNVKRIMREDFSLFSLGIGFDVDYDFLERIATENRGVAQRIFANQDAAEQLRVPELLGSLPNQRTRTVIPRVTFHCCSPDLLQAGLGPPAEEDHRPVPR